MFCGTEIRNGTQPLLTCKAARLEVALLLQIFYDITPEKTFLNESETKNYSNMSRHLDESSVSTKNFKLWSKVPTIDSFASELPQFISMSCCLRRLRRMEINGGGSDVVAKE